MELLHYIGASSVLVLIVLIGIYSGRKVQSAKDFDGGRNASTGLVMGAIIGTLVGGSATIGTAQLAFNYGFSAWWFTLGGGIGVLVLGLVFSKPLYESGVTTIPQLFAREYGKKSSTTMALLNSLGTFLSIVAQIISGVALVTAVSTLSATFATILTVVLMFVYVFFGGSMGTGYVGIVKTVLLYISVGICALIAIDLAGGISIFTNNPLLPHDTYFNILARGAWVDLGAGFSLLLGVLTTQTYITAVLSAKTIKISKRATLLSSLLIPLIGIAGIVIGMFMKLYHPSIDPKMALPLFVLNYIPPLFGGVIIGTLLIAVVGTGAGLALGMSSIFSRDIYKVYFNKNVSAEGLLKVTRIILVAILAVSAIFTMGNLGDLILGWSFMSMGLRGSVAFIPLCTALFLPGKIPSKYIVVSMIAGPFFTLLGKIILPSTIDSLFLGVLASFLIILFGFLRRNQNSKKVIT